MDKGGNMDTCEALRERCVEKAIIIFKDAHKVPDTFDDIIRLARVIEKYLLKG